MSRFDNELVKEADNAWQQSGAPGPTTPRQEEYNQTTTINLDGPFGMSSEAPTPLDEVGGWVADMPMARELDVQDLNAAENGEIVGGSGDSAVYPEGRPMYASLDDSLYSIYKASRDIREAIETQQDFDFNGLVTAAQDTTKFARTASEDQDLVYTIGNIASIVNDIEDNLVVTANYEQAYSDLTSLEGFLEDLNKYASADNDGDEDDKATKIEASIVEREARLAERTEWCSGPGCKIEACDGKMKSKEATNGNQETNRVTDVRDLDDSADIFDFQRTMTPDHVTNVLVPEEVNGEDAGYVNYYNDGAETGKTPQVDDDRNPFPYDGTNPALVGYQAQASVQSSREKIFEALQVVERLEKLGMVEGENRAKHIAKFEQMSDAKLAGFKASLDMLEESGARQPRSQKVASGNNRLPEMGRMTTASSFKRQDVLADDWLMTLN